MTKSMKKLLVVLVAVLSSFGFVGVAAAQTYPQPDPTPRPIRGSTYEPPVATANTGFLGFESVNPTASADAAAGAGGGTTGGLAITGSEAEIPLAIGLALISVGGAAVVASRKREDS